jgi:hypothetical protein
MKNKLTIKDLMEDGHSRADAKAIIAGFAGKGPKITYTEPKPPKLGSTNKRMAKKPVEFELSFSVQGYVKQIIEIVDPKYTPKKILKGLQQGTIYTTIQEDGNVEIIKNGHVVGKVVNVDNECEYFQYELEDEL